MYHAAGTAAMGTVVDTDLKVFGVDHLRVVDASVLPLPLAAHYQACVYALSELPKFCPTEGHPLLNLPPRVARISY